MTFAVVLLALSFVFASYVFVQKKLNLASNYSIFIVFSVIYSVFPVLIYYGIEPRIWFRHFSLNESELLVATQTIIMAACNFIFAGVYLTRSSRNTDGTVSLPNLSGGAWKGVLFLGYMVASLMLIFLGFKFSYTSGRGEMIHSLISNAKVLLAAVYIVYLVCYGFKRDTAIMFLVFAVLLVVEQSRWYFFSVLLATVFYQQNAGKLKTKQLLIVVLVFALLLSFVGLYRCSVEIKDFALFLNPFFIEGDYGSYVNLQTYDLVYRHRIAFYTLFSDYIVDPIIYITPRVLFVSLGLDKDSAGILGLFVRTHQPCLAETYAPIGGYHYIAQASGALPFVGPLIVTYLFALLTIRVENALRRSKLHELAYYLYSAGFMFVFIKTRFDLTVKYYCTLAIPAFILYAIITAKRRQVESEV